ncbi:phosphoribosylformylglycinamidine synthase subunit PurL [Limosilactobacillus mucosae]|jgi:phosphoribosylformylglycinamidine synthase|uniref:Phosphoribosylformylglycinamidine synthase subunit PurL n=2 Tax=Limosilactobacillus mucosae TaxID=97478 RepID=A0A0D4CMJ6_LIMMU|nr:phosphoribosylformylglycinamidine synthase subunit PurL [Limosilactobacillus mucosae]AJT51289.1 phosphoribosylformylglycinamidine synthase [Limosilactobacillus mucosae LM1]MCI1490002.1 phosphoribosylformylglycinamidine synthase subunit PurL [Limosilactobacillus mucosae]MCI1525609.1 phosphoribosylformylglycinamidine synthase subunit PurL [Limosilactobacillus mucosae]MDC2827002.1 phosphoribosylformylglycinamidine synthase subunit PurL [Limosilactobacillus mucosae]MDC2834580.1 phosphoribosylfo
MKQAMTPEEIKEKKPYLDWSLSEKEYDYISEKLLHRLPNYTETGLYSAMWSEHCSYKKSKPVLRLFPNKNDRVLQGPGEGAGVVDIDDGQAVVFKAESHNHPSTVEPYQGAATGVGGILRDIFSMGARPIASLDSLHFGELSDAETRMKVDGVVRGIGDYGNCMGIPTVAGETTFDPCYKGNLLVNAMSVGLMDQKNQQEGNASGVGNAVMYVGAKTGRDGIHGATFASADFGSGNESQHSAVQVGDPFMEKLLMEACLELIQDHAEWLVGIQDMGAAGIVSSSAEMASEGNSGMDLDLDLVPQREPGMSAYEIMLSESQERMLLCVKKGHEEDVKKIFDYYDLEVVTIGRITEGHQYVLHHDGQVVCDIPVSTLTDDVLEVESEEKKPQRLIDAEKEANWVPEIDDVAAVYQELLTQPTIADKSWITRQYDSQVRTSTVVGPGSDAGVIRVRGTKKALSMTTDGNGRLVYLNPYVGGKIALVEAASNIIASGALPLAITDCLNYGDPTDPEIFWELHHSIEGMAEACRVFDTPVISGNVSLYNENNGSAIYPTPMVGMVGLIKDAKYVIPSRVQHAGDKLYLVGKTGDDYAGSELQKMMTGEIAGTLADFDLEHVHDYLSRLLKAEQSGLVASAHDLSEGGLAVAAAETVFKTELGLNADFRALDKKQFFSETPGRMLVSVAPENAAAFEEIMQDDAMPAGEVAATQWLEIHLADAELNLPVAQMQKLWEEALPCAMKSKD